MLLALLETRQIPIKKVSHQEDFFSILGIDILVIIGDTSFNNLHGFTLIVVFGTLGLVAFLIIALVSERVFFRLWRAFFQVGNIFLSDTPQAPDSVRCQFVTQPRL